MGMSWPAARAAFRDIQASLCSKISCGVLPAIGKNLLLMINLYHIVEMGDYNTPKINSQEIALFSTNYTVVQFWLYNIEENFLSVVNTFHEG
jgi:hypothetical protein